MANDPSDPEHAWVDIPISSAEPVKVALLSQFLTEQNIPFERSNTCVSIPNQQVEAVISNIGSWAFKTPTDDDQRNPDSLNQTLQDIGDVVLSAIIQPECPSDLASMPGIELSE